MRSIVSLQQLITLDLLTAPVESPPRNKRESQLQHVCVCALTNRQAWLQNTSLHRSDFLSDENWAFVAVLFVCREYESLSSRRLRMLFLLHAKEKCATIYFSIQLDFVSHHLPYDLLHCIVLLHQPFEPRWRIQTQYCKEIFTAKTIMMSHERYACFFFSSCVLFIRNIRLPFVSGQKWSGDVFNMWTPSLALPVLSSCLQERRNLLCRNFVPC